MILVALNDDQKDVLSHWLHYLIRKMELRHEPETKEFALPYLREIQEQLLHPKKVVMEVGMEQSTPVHPQVTLIDDKIIININL